MLFAEIATVYKVGRAFTNAARHVRDRLRRWMFLPTLKAAHTAWRRHGTLGSIWNPIGDDGIEFSEHLARNPEGPEITRLALRSLGRKYDNAVVVVEALAGNFRCGEGVVFDETRILSGLDKNTRIITLPGIPPYETYIAESGDLASTYSYFRVRITSLTEDGVARAVNLETMMSSPLDQTLAQPYLWKQINSNLFHTGEIVWAKEEQANRIYTRLGQNIFSRAVSSRPVVTALFWIPLVFRLRKFKPRVYEQDRERRRIANSNEQEGGEP